MYFPQYFAPHVAPMGYNPYACYQPAPQYARPMLPQVPQAFFGQYAYRPQHQAHPYNPFAAQYPAYAQPQAAQRVYAQYAPRPQPQAPQQRAYVVPQPQYHRPNYPWPAQPAYNPYYTEPPQPQPQPAPRAFCHAQPQPPVARSRAYARAAQQPAPAPQPQQLPATVTPPRPAELSTGVLSRGAQHLLTMLQSDVYDGAIVAAIRHNYMVSPEEAVFLAQQAVGQGRSEQVVNLLSARTGQAPNLFATSLAPVYDVTVNAIAELILNPDRDEEIIVEMVNGCSPDGLNQLVSFAIANRKNRVMDALLERLGIRQGRRALEHAELYRLWIREAQQIGNLEAVGILSQILTFASFENTS